MYLAKLALAGAMVFGLAGGAAAQTVALGTTKGGSTNQVGTAIANIATTAGEIRVIPQETANTAQYIPMVDQGRIEFGIANYPQTSFAINGKGTSEGMPSPNLRIVASMMDFTSGMLVLKESGIESVADLAGHKVPRFPDKSLGDFVIRAVLATANLTYDDVVPVPTANFPSMFDGLKDGSLDTSIATAGAAHVMDIKASAGDVMFLSFDEEDDEAQMDAVLPGTKVYDITGLEAEGVEGTTKIFGYDYMLFAHVDTPDDVVTSMVKALYEGKEALVATSPLWETFRPEGMARSPGLPYHPAAVAFYEAHGVPVAE
ncbi:TAXI family TRAP transporter solute-binding subunit [Celeribacter litoreus]|uniref:TAXI family TRAP transporter solute-binding subunit n=1 Tax=Celeribacter litoreus TaxID=2876714 RepID=UPI001CC97168|nr:TAXI family TRAP transporter solute-binding subunit [Celeribacter litoreus]MCA0042531.1 TAXI family TRAP transporter solute-binding subunit [Celeribacter litoreus]